MPLKVKVSIAVWLLAAGGYFWLHRGGPPLEPIVVADGAVTVRNQTGRQWQSVRIWVNDHYSGSVKVIPAGGFVREPLSRFVAAQGQRINAASTRIDSVVVLATDADGTAVRVTWGKPFWHLP
ncbi:MAG TPA: hypothetical protein VMZ90_08000 [Vicinamibacterales bacterium]|nr:hypothetical protein [Vicinamibacterales bacterium]